MLNGFALLHCFDTINMHIELKYIISNFQWNASKPKAYDCASC